MTTDQAFALGLRYQQAGRFAEAETVYNSILAVQPTHANALLHLGVVAYNTARYEAAAEFLRRSINSYPNNPLAHANLGEAYRALGQFQEARAACERALQLKPHYPEAFGNLGLVLAGMGCYEDAIASYRQAIALQPDYVEAYNNLGAALARRNLLEDAIASYERAIQLRPDYAEAHHNLGLGQSRLGRFDEAIASYSRAIRIEPNYADACNNLGIALVECGRIDEALVAYQRALELRPAFPEVYSNVGIALAKMGRREEAIVFYGRALELKRDYVDAQYNMGTVLGELDRLDEAIEAYRRVLELKADHAEAHNNLGNALKDQRRLPEAVDCFRHAITCRADFADAHLNLGIVLLLLGGYEEGWREYEWRLRSSDKAGYAHHSTLPVWEGEIAERGSILVYAEQGFGDTLQFVRYLPLLCAQSRAARVILDCPPGLVSLLKQLGTSVVEIVARGVLPAEPAGFDYQVSLLSLPQKLGQYAPLAVGRSYLQVNPQMRDRWRSRLESSAGFRVGLAWAGNPTYVNDRRRSIAPELLMPLLQVEGIRFVSLQVYPRSQILQTKAHADVIDLSAGISDFADSAALITELDLIITVDTATAHLAGALGKPVWLLLPLVPDWRWGLEGESTPWYPTMRLFRQTTANDWATVVERVASSLRDLLAGAL